MEWVLQAELSIKSKLTGRQAGVLALALVGADTGEAEEEPVTAVGGSAGTRRGLGAREHSARELHSCANGRDSGNMGEGPSPVENLALLLKGGPLPMERREKPLILAPSSQEGIQSMKVACRARGQVLAQSFIICMSEKTH